MGGGCAGEFGKGGLTLLRTQGYGGLKKYRHMQIERDATTCKLKTKNETVIPICRNFCLFFFFFTGEISSCMEWGVEGRGTGVQMCVCVCAFECVCVREIERERDR